MKQHTDRRTQLDIHSLCKRGLKVNEELQSKGIAISWDMVKYYFEKSRRGDFDIDPVRECDP